MSWFQLLVVAALAPILLVWWEIWSTSRRWRLKYRLRSLFIVTTWASVTCAIAGLGEWSLAAFIVSGVFTAIVSLAALMVFYVVTDIFPRPKTKETSVTHRTIEIGSSENTVSAPRPRRRFERWRMARTQWGRNGRS